MAPVQFDRVRHGGAMENAEIAKVLDEIADLLEIGGENFFRVRAYRNAARTVRDFPGNVAALERKQLGQMPGIGAGLADSIATLVESGDLPIRSQLLATFPPGLLELRHVPGLGPKRIKQIAQELHIRDRDELEAALRSGALRTLRGFGAKMEQRILDALTRKPPEPQRRISWADAAPLAMRILKHLKICPAIERAKAAGSFRRRRDTVGDLDIVAVSGDATAAMAHFASFPEIAQSLGAGETRTSVILTVGLQVDLRVIPARSWGAALLYFTGSQAHCVRLRRLAQLKGMLLNEYGLYRGDELVAGATEEAVYGALGLEWIASELREERGEVEAARDHRLPLLLTRADLRGDLHSHSTYTDGRASIEEMAIAARDHGLEYFALTDHSQHLAMVKGLDPVRLREQWREIDQVRGRVSGIKILRGIEVDIMEDGTLDLPDEVLDELDWVVASVHYKLNQPADEMTRRMVRAMQNPYVDVIGHPTGRILNRREPSGFDLDEVLRVAREEGCALEVNSQPDRLDLTDIACLTAKRAGVKLVVSSDSHSPRGFGLLEHGVNQARRGWVEASDVLNSRPLESLRVRRGFS
ncbi:MAG: DNA polymerase/3'-5' exonuclease PolX [Candidatus Binataceae bacterium]